MIIDIKSIEPSEIYKILIGSIMPRPIAWVSTVDASGETNLAPFSFFTVASAFPPVVCFSPSYKAGAHNQTVPKDTLKNIRQTKEFVVNIVSHNLAEQMNLTSGDYEHGVSEFAVAGVTAAPSQMVRPPRVGESLVNMECKLRQIVEFGEHPGAGNLILGDIVCFHLDDKIYEHGHINAEILQPIGRMGGFWYSTIKDRFELPRPIVAKK